MQLRGVQLAGRYELVREIAQDADARVWDGYDRALDRPVVIKLLQPALRGNAEAIERFNAAARAAARRAANAGPRVLDAGSDQSSAIPFVVFQTQDEAIPEAESPTRLMPRVQPRAATSNNHRLMLAVLLVPLVAGVVIVRGLLNLPSPTASLGKQPVLPTAAAAPTQVQPVATAQPTVAPPRPTPSPTQPAGVRRRIVNTDGIGVALRSAPGGPRLPGRGYDEGATVTVLEQSGAWSHIRGDDGREGWVLAVTLG
jgi:hypothetical protein